MFWGNFFEKFFCPVFHGGSSLWNVFIDKFKKFCKILVLNMFWGKFFEKFFCPVFQIPKTPKIVPKLSNVFWTCFGVIFSKMFFAQCSMEGRVFEKVVSRKRVESLFQKIRNFAKFPKWWVESMKCLYINSKNFPNSKNAQSCPNVFWTCFGVIFSKNFFAQC